MLRSSDDIFRFLEVLNYDIMLQGTVTEKEEEKALIYDLIFLVSATV